MVLARFAVAQPFDDRTKHVFSCKPHPPSRARCPTIVPVDDRGSTLWVRRNERGRFVECVVRPIPTGVELEIRSDGSTLLLHRFDGATQALAWAADVRQLLSQDD